MNLSPSTRPPARPLENRARMEYRTLRHIVRSARQGFGDFVRQGLESALRIPVLSMADLSRRDRHECNICGWSGRTFYPNTGPGYHEMEVACPGCSSQDRHRSLLALMLSETDLFTSGRRVVEVAPMRGFERLMRLQEDLDYVSFDLERHAMERGDITAMRYETGSVGYFVCFHVLEHIPDADTALKEILRILEPGGQAIVQVPVDWDLPVTREYAAPDPRDVGHVRQYGKDFPAKLSASGFDVRGVSVTERLDSAVIDRFGLSPEPIFFLTKPH